MCLRIILHPKLRLPISVTLFTFFLFASFYLCLHIFWPGYITSLIAPPFFSLWRVGVRDMARSPIYGYIPTWYHEFIYNMQQCFRIPYRFLIIISFHCFFHVVFTFFSFLINNNWYCYKDIQPTLRVFKAFFIFFADFESRNNSEWNFSLLFSNSTLSSVFSVRFVCSRSLALNIHGFNLNLDEINSTTFYSELPQHIEHTKKSLQSNYHSNLTM